MPDPLSQLYYPRIAIGIITYNRLELLCQVIQAYQDFIIYPSEQIRWVLSDDGSPDGYLSAVDDKFPGLFSRVIQHQRKGMGYNWNRMIETCEDLADFTLCCQDDWLLTTPLDLRLGVLFLKHNGNQPPYGMVRYHKLTGHVGLPMQMKEMDMKPVAPGFYFSENEYMPSMLPYLDLLPGNGVFSPYSGGVHLRHKIFRQCYGKYVEGTGFSNAEQDYMFRVDSLLANHPDAAVRIAMFPQYIYSKFRDIGQTYRGTLTESETIKQ